MTETPDVVQTLRAAYRDAAASNLDRAHDDIVADAAARVGVPLDVAAAALPRLASREWQRAFSPTRNLPPIPDDLTVEAATHTLQTEPDPAVRALTVEHVLAYAIGERTADVILIALNDADAAVREVAVRRSWLASGPLKDVNLKISELLEHDPNLTVRAAALRRAALTTDTTPATVAALLATISPASDRSLRIAASAALAAAGTGYARVCRALLRWARIEDDVPVRTALLDAATALTTERELPHLFDTLMHLGRDMRVAMFLRSRFMTQPAVRTALRDLAIPKLADHEPETRRAAVHLLSIAASNPADPADVATQRAIIALGNDPDEQVRDAVYVTSPSRSWLEETQA